MRKQTNLNLARKFLALKISTRIFMYVQNNVFFERVKDFLKSAYYCEHSYFGGICMLGRRGLLALARWEQRSRIYWITFILSGLAIFAIKTDSTYYTDVCLPRGANALSTCREGQAEGVQEHRKWSQSKCRGKTMVLRFITGLKEHEALE